jgi:hypothetical protein
MSESEISRQVLDQLADGELARADYADVLRQLDRRPEEWRRCALTFLEHQALQCELSEIISSRQTFEPVDDGEESDTALGGGSAGESYVSTAVHRNWWARPVVRWTSVMAVGVLAFVGGIALQVRPENQPMETAQTNQAVLKTPLLASQPRSPAEGSASIWLDDLGAGDSPHLEVPVRLISANASDKLAPERIPPMVETLLPQSGSPNFLERRVLMVRTQSGEIILFTVDRVTHGITYQ